MGDFIVCDSKDQYRRGREGGGSSTSVEKIEHPIWDNFDKFSKSDRDIIKYVDFVIDNVDKKKIKNAFNHELLGLITKIEKNNPKFNRFTIILCMVFCVDFTTNLFDRYGKENLNLFVKRIWKEFESVIPQGSKNVENTLKEKKMLIHLRIYKATVLVNSKILTSYVGAWEQTIHILHYKKIQQHNNKRENVYSSQIIQRVKDTKKYSITPHQGYLDVILDVKATNGTNACYINTVLFLWSCHPKLRDLMVYNDFFDQQSKHEIESLLRHKWGDSLYLKYFHLFKREKLMDIPENYGEFSHPHSIISFMCESIFNCSGLDFEVDMDSIYNLTTFEEFKDVLRRNKNKKQLLGIIKTVERIPIDLPLND